MTTPSPSDDTVRCPACQSAQIHAEKRGWNAWSGMIGAGKIVITCLKCGHKFAPGAQPILPIPSDIRAAEQVQSERSTGVVILLVVLVLVVLVLLAALL